MGLVREPVLQFKLDRKVRPPLLIDPQII